MASFNVAGPTGVSMTATPGSPEVDTGVYSTGPSPELSFGDSGDTSGLDLPAGITFSASVTPPSADEQGGLMSVQLVNQDSWFDLTNEGVSPTQYKVSPSAAPVLDAQTGDRNYPYEDTYLNTLSTDDSPAIQLSSGEGELQRNFAATMYLMWDPLLPTGCIPATSKSATVTCTSIPVPLGFISWQFSGAATNAQQIQSNPNPNGAPNNTPWFVNNCGGCSSPLTFVPSQSSQTADGYPVWSTSINP
jgi:hypothetical protein